MALKATFKTKLTGVYDTDVEGVGTIRWENNKCYKFVKYSEGTGTLDVVAGDVVMYDDASMTQVLADQTDIAAKAIGAGVIVAASVDADAKYIWIQIKGPATVAVALGGSAGDGDPLTTEGAADKALIKAVEADSAAVYKHVCAVAIDATAKTIFCDFPF